MSRNKNKNRNGQKNPQNGQQNPQNQSKQNNDNFDPKFVKWFIGKYGKVAFEEYKRETAAIQVYSDLDAIRNDVYVKPVVEEKKKQQEAAELAQKQAIADKAAKKAAAKKAARDRQISNMRASLVVIVVYGLPIMFATISLFEKLGF